MLPALPLSQVNQSSSTLPEETARVTVSVSEGGWDTYPAAIASRPVNGPAGTPTKRIVASGAKRPAKASQSPDRTLSLNAATCSAARRLIGSPRISAPGSGIAEVVLQDEKHLLGQVPGHDRGVGGQAEGGLPGGAAQPGRQYGEILRRGH